MNTELDMTETTLTVPKYIKDYVVALAKQKAADKGRRVPQKEYLTDLIRREFKKTRVEYRL